MTLFMCVVVTILSVHLVMMWRLFEERSRRWELYALRDQLRMAGANSKRVRDSAAFRTVDVALTALAANLKDFSLWTLVPALARADRSGSAEGVQDEIENAPAEVRAVIREASGVLVRHLASRHLLLWAIIVATIVGKTSARKLVAWASDLALLGVIEPPSRHPIEIGGQHPRAV